MQKEAVSGFRKMIADGDALVVGADDDVHGIVLAFVIALNHCTLTIRPLLIVQHQLVVVIADAGILTIKRCPRAIHGRTILARQLQIAAPILMDSTRYGQGRLKETVVNINAQLSMRYNQLIFIRNTISHTIDLDDVVAIGR